MVPEKKATIPAPTLIPAYIPHPLLLPVVTGLATTSAASKEPCSLSKGTELLDSGSCDSEREDRETQIEGCHVRRLGAVHGSFALGLS